MCAGAQDAEAYNIKHISENCTTTALSLRIMLAHLYFTHAVHMLPRLHFPSAPDKLSDAGAGAACVHGQGACGLTWRCSQPRQAQKSGKRRGPRRAPKGSGSPWDGFVRSFCMTWVCVCVSFGLPFVCGVKGKPKSKTAILWVQPKNRPILCIPN